MNLTSDDNDVKLKKMLGFHIALYIWAGKLKQEVWKPLFCDVLSFEKKTQ